jgi:hypothetical protein
MMETIGRRRAFYAVGVTIGIAVMVGGLARFALAAWGAIAA